MNKSDTLRPNGKQSRNVFERNILFLIVMLNDYYVFNIPTEPNNICVTLCCMKGAL